MVKKETFNVLPVLFMIYIVITLCSLGIVLTLVAVTPRGTADTDYISFGDSWLSEDGDFVDLENMVYSAKVHKTLPVINSDCVIFMRAKNLNVRVMIDGQEISSDYEITLAESFGYKTPGTYFLTVPLMREYSGKELVLDIECPYEDNSSNIKSMYIGSAESIMASEVKSKLPGFVISSLLSFLGILFLIISVPLKKYDNNVSSLANLGLFSLMAGIWATTETKLLQLLIGHTAIIHMVTGLTLMLIAPPLFIFFKSRYKGMSRWSALIICTIFPICYLASIALHFFRIKDMHENLWLAHIGLGTGVIFALIQAFQTARERRFKDPVFLGLLGIACCSGLDIVLYYFQITSDNSTFVRIGALCYIAFLGVQILGDYAKVYQQGKQAELIYRLAYEDLLTGMFNRNSFMDDLKDINGKIQENQGRIIAIFDVNCLKYINDRFGHNMGDAVLKEGADLVKEYFGDIAKCYRTGGDEFAIICNNSSVTAAEMELRHMKFEEHIKQRNQKDDPDRPYPLYVAFGFAAINGNENSAKEAMNVADQRMYRNKKQIKDALKLVNADYVRV